VGVLKDQYVAIALFVIWDWIATGIKRRAPLHIWLGSCINSTATLSILLVLEEIDMVAGRITSGTRLRRQALWVVLYIADQLILGTLVLWWLGRVTGISVPRWLIVIVVIAPLAAIKIKNRFFKRC